VLSVLRQTARREPATKSVAVFADPVFDKDDPRLQLAIRARPAAPEQSVALTRALRETDGEGGDVPKLARLLASGREARDILSLTPPGSSMEATGFKASRENLTDIRLSQYRVVHFATHGILNEKNPELSGVVLSLYDEQGRFREDGFLRFGDIFGLSLPVDLIVLSACRTGLGKEARGEGLIGLTRGFMYAGAPRVIASLWKVDDDATAELMKRFYQKMLKDGMTPASALRAAQASMFAQRRWGNPYYWAGFILQGEPK
jgi:CHAT domain-containing protein